MSKEFPFKIGTDPEFNFSLQKRMINAESLIKNLLEDKGTKKEMGYKFPTGEIGWDGYSATAELRPKAEHNPLKLANNIGQLINIITTETAMMELKTSSELAAVGGHIHLEIPDIEPFDKDKIRRDTNGDPTIYRILKTVCSFMAPIIFGESLLNAKIRNSKGYGELFDARVSFPSDNVITLEMRQPSAEWLTSSKITEGVLAYMAVIWNEILYHPDNIQKHKALLITRKEQGRTITTLAGEPGCFLAQMLLKRTQKAVRTFSAYNDFKDELEFIMNPKKVLKEKAKTKNDIIIGWHMEKKKTLKDLVKKQKKLEKNMERLTEIINLNFNEDFMMATLMDKLKGCIVAKSWKLTNEYAFYGVNSSISSFVITRRNKAGGVSINTKEELTYELAKKILDSISKLENKLGVWLHDNVIFIGVPLETRKKKDIKSLIKVIYGIETNRIKPQQIDFNRLPHTTHEKEKELENEEKENKKMEILGTDVTREENRIRARDAEGYVIREQETSPIINNCYLTHDPFNTTNT